MIKRILVNGFLTSVLQIALFIIIIYSGWSLVQIIHDPTKKEIYEFNFGAQVYIVGVGLILLITNLLIAIINRVFWTRALIIILASIFVVGLITSLKYGTWDSSLLEVALILTVISKFAIEKLVLTIVKKVNSGFVPNQP